MCRGDEACEVRRGAAAESDDPAVPADAELAPEALGDGETVNRAIGIVMAQRACSAEAALDVLLDTANQLHLPLWTVTERLVDTITNRARVQSGANAANCPD